MPSAYQRVVNSLKNSVLIPRDTIFFLIKVTVRRFACGFVLFVFGTVLRDKRDVLYKNIAQSLIDSIQMVKTFSVKHVRNLKHSAKFNSRLLNS